MSYQIKLPLDLHIHQDLQDFDYRFKYLNNQFRGRYKTTEINTSYPTKKDIASLYRVGYLVLY